jgi:hypothetical protein
MNMATEMSRAGAAISVKGKCRCLQTLCIIQLDRRLVDSTGSELGQ